MGNVITGVVKNLRKVDVIGRKKSRRLFRKGQLVKAVVVSDNNNCRRYSNVFIRSFGIGVVLLMIIAIRMDHAYLLRV